MQYLINRFIYHICIWLLEIQNNPTEVNCFIARFVFFLIIGSRCQS